MKKLTTSPGLRSLVTALAIAVPLAGATACERSTDEERSAKAAVVDGRGSSDDPSLIERLTAPKTREFVVPEGTKIAVRLSTSLSSQTSGVGDRVVGVIDADVLVGETTVIPAGSTVYGTVTSVHPLPKIGGRASLAFNFDRLETRDGKDYPIAAMFARTGPSETAKDTSTIIAGAIIGAVAGHQVDDDQGRAVGGLAGAGIGTAIAAATDGKAITLPEGTRLRLTLRIPVPIEVRA